VTKSHRWLHWLPAGAYMLLIWVLSSIPQPFPLGEVPFQDKGIHFVEYGVLAALLAHAVRGSFREWRAALVFLVAWTATAFWGLLDEIHQAYVPGRVSDSGDVLADALGGVLGALIYLAIRARQDRKVATGAAPTPP
jgi:VanZ family protein